MSDLHATHPARVAAWRPRTIVAAFALAALSVLAAAPSASAVTSPKSRAPAPKKAAPRKAKVVWTPAPAATAAIHPGVQTFTKGTDATGAAVDNQCTANFVFTQETATKTRVFLGQAAHCAGTGQATETDGCLATSLPLGATVEIAGSDGRTYAGTMAYSSWLTMQGRRETNPDACRGNDLALIELSDAAALTTNPSLPFWGGPTGLASGIETGGDVYSYGNSGLRAGLTPLSPKYGQAVGTDNGGWTYDVYTASPGVPGDSGSAFVDSNGKALGVLSTLSVLPLPASNQVSDLARGLGYLRQHAGIGDVSLVNGTEPFVPLF